MNIIAKLFIALWVAILAQIAMADTAKGSSTITISNEVKHQLQKLPSNERKRVESAIAVGNRFVPFYLDGSYYLVVDELWERKIRPLVNKNAEDWYATLNKKASDVELEIAQREATNLVSICPQVELIQFKLPPNLVLLKYRSRIVNVHKLGNDGSALADLILDNSVDFQGVWDRQKISRFCAAQVLRNVWGDIKLYGRLQIAHSGSIA